MSLWIDRHRPVELKGLDYHQEQASQMAKLVEGGDFPHLLVYGPPGAGKKTRVMCLLRELYGPGVERLRLEHQSFYTPSKKKIDINTIASNYHIEVNPSDVGIYDRVVIQELIKTVASTDQLDHGSQRDFKVVVLTEVDKLTKDAQHGLRRTMEKYMATCRIILITNSTSKVIPAIQSRCLAVRIPAPTHQQITDIVMNIAKQEECAMPQKLVQRIAEKSGRNLRRAILMAEACRVQQPHLTANQEIQDLDWQTYIKETADLILKEQSPRRLLEVRGRLYELLAHTIPAELIFVELLKELTRNCDGVMKNEVVHWASVYEHRMNKGSKQIFHLEAFVAKFMSLHMKMMDDVMGAF